MAKDYKDCVEKLWRNTSFSLKSLKSLLKGLIRKSKAHYFFIVESGNDDFVNYYYFSFIRVYSNEGKYLFSLPLAVGRAEEEEEDYDEGSIYDVSEILEDLGLKKIKEEEVGILYTRFPENPAKSRNGGDYYQGFVVTYSNVLGYIIRFYPNLHSDFEIQGISKPLVFQSFREIISHIENNLKERILEVDITNEKFNNKVWEGDSNGRN